MATSRAALSAPVWPPDMIFWSIMEEITGCFEEIQGILISGFCLMGVYHPIFVEISG